MKPDYEALHQGNRPLVRLIQKEGIDIPSFLLKW
jgi:hypothetical protein